MHKTLAKFLLMLLVILSFSACSKKIETSIIDIAPSWDAKFTFPNKYISVKNFGAIGNGIADETTAFIKAQDYAYANKIALLIPTGFYKINLELKYDSLVIFGENKPIVKGDSLVNGAVIIGSLNAKNKRSIEIDNLGVWSQEDAILTGDGLGSQILNQKYFNISLLGTGFLAYKHGFLCQSGWGIQISNFTVTSFYHGIAIRASDVNITNVEANKCGFTSIVVKSATGGNDLAKNVNINNVIITGDSTDVYSRGGTILVQSFDDNCVTKNINVSNIKSYHGGVGTINIEQRKGRVDSVRITNCYSYKTGDNPIRSSYDVLGAATNIKVFKSFENGSKVAAYDGPFTFLELNNQVIIP
jgi:hypothetical protein